MFNGGIRRHPLDEPELEAISDGLNLGRAMSFKNVPSGVHYGGAKTVVMSDPLDSGNMEQMGFIAYCIDKARGMSTPDMRMPKDMVTVMLDNFSQQWLAGIGSRLGSSAVPTGIGVAHALKQAVKFKMGKDSLDGVSIALQGLGDVGSTVLAELVKEKTKLFITDLDMDLAKKMKAKYPDHDITVVDGDEIMNVDADVLCPCAIGGVISEENIPTLKFKVIVGAANNQLKATSQEEEIRLAKMLEERGILFQVDWWHNCGGVICAIEEYENQDATFESVVQKVVDRVSTLTWKMLNQAKEQGLSPTELIYSESEKVVYGNQDKLSV